MPAMIPYTKTCSKCGETKTSDQFYKRNKSKDGLRSECKTCNSGAFREWRRANPEKHTEIERRSNLKKYNITPDEYSQLLEQQGHRCACCGKHQSELAKRLAVDHCHITGEIRGLLCFDCNSGIGKLGDNEEGLLKALVYLRRSR